MGDKPRIEIIQVGLDNFDIGKEIREKTDHIKVDTSRFPNLKKVTKKQRDSARWDDKVKMAVDLLVDARDKDRLVPATEIISAAEIDQKQLGGFSTRIRAYLRREDQWTLMSKRIKNVQNYWLAQFDKP